MKWFTERRQVAAALKFQRGYDWVAGALLRGTPEHEIDTQLDNPFDSDEFEKGGKQAVLDFNNLILKGRIMIESGQPVGPAETFTQPKITGYRQLSQFEADLMNKIKAKGIEIGALLVEMREHCKMQTRAAIEAQDMVEIRRLDCAQAYRWTAIAQTDFQTALMALTRAVAQPSSF